MTDQNCTCNGGRPCYHCSIAAPLNPDAVYAAWESNNGYTEGIRIDDVERMIRSYFAVAQPVLNSFDPCGLNRKGWTCGCEPGNYDSCDECQSGCNELADFLNRPEVNDV